MPEPTTTRSPLPEDATALPPMGDAFDAGVAAVIEELGLSASVGASDEARTSYELHARLLVAWGAAINLTAIRDPGAIAVRHIGDALTAVTPIEQRGSVVRRLLDLGSGGGYPGLPLAAALRPNRVVLLDSVGKKARFLGVAGAAVRSALMMGGQAPFIEAVPERAEDVAEDPDSREAFDVVTARAIGPLSEVMELALPLVSVGGVAVAWKRDGDASDLRAELRDAGRIIGLTGGGRPEVTSVPGTTFADHRLVLVTKERPTPASYPRAAGVRRKGRR